MVSLCSEASRRIASKIELLDRQLEDRRIVIPEQFDKMRIELTSPETCMSIAPIPHQPPFPPLRQNYTIPPSPSYPSCPSQLTSHPPHTPKKPKFQTTTRSSNVHPKNLDPQVKAPRSPLHEKDTSPIETTTRWLGGMGVVERQVYMLHAVVETKWITAR